MAAMIGNKWRWFAVAAVVKLSLTGLVLALAAPSGRSAAPSAEQALKLASDAKRRRLRSPDGRGGRALHDESREA